MLILSGIRDYLKESGNYLPDLVQSDAFQFEVQIPAAGAPLIQAPTIRVPAGYYFVARKLVGYYQRFPLAVLADLSGIPLTQFQVRESGSKRNMFDQAISLALIVGSDATRKEFELPTFYRFKAGADMTPTFTITNVAAWAALALGAAKIVGVAIVGDLVAETVPTEKQK